MVLMQDQQQQQQPPCPLLHAGIPCAPVHLQQHAHDVLRALLAAQQGINGACTRNQTGHTHRFESMVSLMSHCPMRMVQRALLTSAEALLCKVPAVARVHPLPPAISDGRPKLIHMYNPQKLQAETTPTAPQHIPLSSTCPKEQSMNSGMLRQSETL